MALHLLKKGLDLPMDGGPEQTVHAAPTPRHVALLADDYLGLKPSLLVQPGDTVRRGQALFEDKRCPGLRFTSPGAGTVQAVNRGERRALISVVIELNENERRGALRPEDTENFPSFSGKDPAAVPAAEIKALLLESGLWSSLRTRPFSRVADPNTQPHSIFVTAMDTNPHAPSLDVITSGREGEMNAGLRALRALTAGPVYFCRAAESSIRPSQSTGVTIEDFAGPHPAGLPGTHIHILDAVGLKKTVWYVGLQDVIAMGVLLRTGRLEVERVVSLAGPAVSRPRLLRTRLGASLDDVVAGDLAEGEVRLLSGSVLSGRAATGIVSGYLGRYHQQISALREDRARTFLGWLSPGADIFSVAGVFASKLAGDRTFAFTTTTNGSRRAMVPIGLYEKVMPLDILPTFLLRSLIVGDIEKAEQLGCLELDEEDLALCTFVCPGKYEYGPILRRNLNIIEKEG